jgi:acylphosphatase
MSARRVIFEGRVQGVGFRYTARNIARGFDVTGWVRNLPDGRVEMEAMAEDAEELDAFVNEIRENSPLAHLIRRVSVEDIPPLVGSRGFEIRM